MRKHSFVTNESLQMRSATRSRCHWFVYMLSSPWCQESVQVCTFQAVKPGERQKRPEGPESDITCPAAGLDKIGHMRNEIAWDTTISHWKLTNSKLINRYEPIIKMRIFVLGLGAPEGFPDQRLCSSEHSGKPACSRSFWHVWLYTYYMTKYGRVRHMACPA